MRHPLFPIYIPSKGRSANCLTAKMFDREGVSYKLVVEPSQVEPYTHHGYGDKLLVLPENSRGLVYSRRWITDYSRSRGEKRHWQIDDDVRNMRRVFNGDKVYCNSGDALRICEDFAERYENVALVAPNSSFFVTISRGAKQNPVKPFLLNYRCYTAVLMLNEVPFNWRYPNNEDTDMTLQCLAGGWCTVLMNAVLIDTLTTMTAKGGQTESFIAGARLEMVRALERKWPGVVTVSRRFGHPQHVVDWSKFDNKLIRRADVDWGSLPEVDDFGMKLIQIREVKGNRSVPAYAHHVEKGQAR